MYFKTGYTYHIYNRGNNKNMIFFQEENYLFFLKKVRKELSDYFNFLAYCLMPNHFHFLVQVKELSYSSNDFKSSDEWLKVRNSSDDSKSSDEYLSKQISKQIAILLRSYTRAINKQENRTGSLFQQKTKAKCLNEMNNGKNNYVVACFNYIHQNPYSSGLVDKLEDWKFSSFLDYAALRSGTLCDQTLALEMVNYNKENFIEQSYAVIEEKELKGIWV
ncbi:MAG: hypothetical protein K8S16_00015 [Bacteroidales bacterium]|nr:hypothetical protein [Bacteroidales bacterium]